MTRRNPRRVMDQIYSRVPEGDEYPIELAQIAPEDRGQLGRVRIREQTNGTNGAPPSVRELWWLRCPWCRELLELPIPRLHVEAGRIRIDGTVVCSHCESTYVVEAGTARRIPNVESAGQDDVTSEPVTAS